MNRRVLAVLSGLLLFLPFATPARAGAATTGVVSGIVLDGESPVAGVTAQVGERIVTTDAAGQFRIADVAPGEWRVTFVFPGGLTQYYPPGNQVFTLKAGQVEQVTEQAGPHGSVVGTVLTSNGAAAPGATAGVTWVRENADTTTDADGHFALPYVTPRAATYLYVQRKPTGAPRQWVPGGVLTPVTIEAGEVLRIEERLLPLGLITGTFAGAAGSFGPTVQAVGDAGTVQAPIAGDGSYELYVWPGDYRLHYQASTIEQWAPGVAQEAEAAVFHVEQDQVVRHDEQLIPA
jgi:hypothetical protein